MSLGLGLLLDGFQGGGRFLGCAGWRGLEMLDDDATREVGRGEIVGFSTLIQSGSEVGLYGFDCRDGFGV